jgi:hypothetical protein
VLQSRVIMLPHGPNRPLTRSERSTLVGFSVVLFGLFAADVAVDYSPAKLSILFFISAWFPLMVVHESGHALTAALLGWRVKRVVIGFGRTLMQFELKKTPVEIRMIPLEGFTSIAPRNLQAPRLKSFLIYFAGPGAEIIVLLLLVVATGIDTLLTRTESVPIIAAQAAAVAIILGLFSNLIPHAGDTQNGRSPNDGLGMILSLSLNRKQIREWAEEDGDDSPEGSNPSTATSRP